ncbi:ATG8F [Symbiodinium microadriaticum]|nr:ATG8F [Symbiodinium microadriaticum]CAE7939850.1 ATG8F [Symbiodinium sp. KB8]|mmetsp:Transcript_126168/g.299586  ORF Transcript_126168/g.299586 Transcript_126168/m.299586 type:complete len:308 (+) Transcript_126168:56-979(+)
MAPERTRQETEEAAKEDRGSDKASDDEAQVPLAPELTEHPSPEGDMAESVMDLPWLPSGTPSSDHDRRIMGAAASIGGTAGLMLANPVSGLVLGTAAMYATSRDDTAGAVARKAGAVYLHLADWAVDRGLQGVHLAGALAEEGCRKLLQKSASLDLDACQQVPAPVRRKLKKWSGLASQAMSREVPRPPPEEVVRLRARIPLDRVPVLCEPSRHANLPKISQRKFAVPGSMLCGEFKYMVHKHVMQAIGKQSANAEQTLYIFVDGVMPKSSDRMGDLYERWSADDGFLHVRYCAENTLGAFGCHPRE